MPPQPIAVLAPSALTGRYAPRSSIRRPHCARPPARCASHPSRGMTRGPARGSLCSPLAFRGLPAVALAGHASQHAPSSTRPGARARALRGPCNLGKGRCGMGGTERGCPLDPSRATVSANAVSANVGRRSLRAKRAGPSSGIRTAVTEGNEDRSEPRMVERAGAFRLSNTQLHQTTNAPGTNSD